MQAKPLRPTGVNVLGILAIRNAISAVQGMIVTAIPGAIVAQIIAYYRTTPTVKGFSENNPSSPTNAMPNPG